MTTTILPDGSRHLSAAAPLPTGWVVETIIDGRMAWMIKPEPLQPYTFTFDLARAHVFDAHHQARDSAASVWCWHDTKGMRRNFDVRHFDEQYRASFAEPTA